MWSGNQHWDGPRGRDIWWLNSLVVSLFIEILSFIYKFVTYPLDNSDMCSVLNLLNCTYPCHSVCHYTAVFKYLHGMFYLCFITYIIIHPSWYFNFIPFHEFTLIWFTSNCNYIWLYTNLLSCVDSDVHLNWFKSNVVPFFVLSLKQNEKKDLTY